MNRYTFDRKFSEVFQRAGVDLQELLRRSELPADLFSRSEILLTRTEYYRLVEVLGQMEAEIPQLAERIALDGQIESFAPPVFAAYCSEDGYAFLSRLSLYKKLVGPMKIELTEQGDEVTVSIGSDASCEPIPEFFTRLELMFLLGVLSKGTQQAIQPLRTSPSSLVFARADPKLPFVSRNEAMWQYFEPELRHRLEEMELDDSTAARVRSILVELLPAGKTAAEDVACRLFLSKRTLQRKLAEEKTTFQSQLNSTRMLLAKNYLRNSDRTCEEIAFLLGYEDTSSFLRAFVKWTGKSVTEYKREQD